MKHTNRQVIGLLIAAMLCLLFAINVTSFACEDLTCMVHAATTVSPLAGLSIGIALLLIAMAVEWNAILNNVRVESMSLNVVEAKHPRLPKKFEIAIASILSISLFILFVQFVLTVYAMSFSLNSSTSEVKDTKQVISLDMDGDGDLDYVAFNAATQDHDFYINNGAGSFTAASTISHNDSMLGTDAGDIDGDGDIDFLISDTATVVRKFVNNGAGGFSASNIGSLANAPSSMNLFDVENDGDVDLVFVSSVAISSGVFLNDGHGTFTAAAAPLPAGLSITHADFNSDGYQDLAMSDSSQNFKVYLNSGTGSFAQSYLTVAGLNGPIIAGDFDGDGDIDVVFSNSSHQIRADLNNGAGTSFSFAGAATASNLSPVKSLAAADVDNDGDLDIIAGGGTSLGGARLYLNDGTGVFTENGSATETTDSVYGIVIGDIDGDGDLDYIRGNDGGGLGAANRHYKSDQAATSANTAPTASALSTLTGAYVAPSPKAPNTAADDSSVGAVTWGSVSNALQSDDAYASLSLSPSAISHYLTVTNFRFSVPTNATILGVKAEVERKNGSTGQIQDNAVRLVKGGVIGSTDRSVAGDWPTSIDAYQTYGSGGDLWGTTLTPSDVNASDFGFAISVVNPSGLNPAPSAQIDYVRITVYYSMASIRLSWGSGSDTETTTRLLQYQLQIGTGSNSNSFYSGKTASPNFVTRLLPNGQSRTELMRNVPCNHTYYWSVAAVDTGYKSTRSSEKTFTLDASCAFSIPASASSSSSAGGSMWKIPKVTVEPKIVQGHLTVSAFEDINGNGKKDSKEKNGFAGLAITASGTTAGSGTMFKTVTLSDAGEATFDLEPSDARGYRLSVDTGASILKDYVFLGQTASGAHVIREGSQESVSFAFRRRSLLGYKPCLDIDVAKTDAKSKNDAGLLLSKLQDSFSSSVLNNLDLSGALVTRRAFLTLLLRTQCIPLRTNPMDVMKQATSTHLLDLGQAFMTSDGLMFYSLLAEGLPVLRSTANGFAADLSAPISRREAVTLLRAAMKLETPVSGSGDTLPIDLTPDDPIVPDFFALKNIGILPKSFLHVFGAEQGIDPVEMPILFTRAAFRSGHISLLPVTFDESSQQGSHAAAAETPATFLDDLPSLPLRSCLETDPKRSNAVTFSDLLPGDARESSVRSLLSFGTKNDDDKTLWLLTGTKKPTEFGIRKGSLALNASAPVSLLETIRTLLVLRCLPPPTAKESLPQLSKSIEGSADSRVTRDLLSGLKRDTTFESRTLYRAQDHEKEFDLSLFTFAPRLLQGESRPPDSPLSIEDGSVLLASALLNLFVHEGLLSTQEAENKSADLSLALQKQFLGDTDLSQSRILPLSRGMLLDYLSTILIPKKTVEEEEASKDSLGEIWWKRVGE